MTVFVNKSFSVPKTFTHNLNKSAQMRDFRFKIKHTRRQNPPIYSFHQIFEFLNKILIEINVFLKLILNK